jgi:hypothetical protein
MLSLGGDCLGTFTGPAIQRAKVPKPKLDRSGFHNVYSAIRWMALQSFFDRLKTFLYTSRAILHTSPAASSSADAGGIEQCQWPIRGNLAARPNLQSPAVRIGFQSAKSPREKQGWLAFP